MTSWAWPRGRASESYRVMLGGSASNAETSPRQQEARARLSNWCEARGICLLPQQPSTVRTNRRSGMELGRLMRACFAEGVEGYLVRIDLESVPLLKPCPAVEWIEATLKRIDSRARRQEVKGRRPNRRTRQHVRRSTT